MADAGPASAAGTGNDGRSGQRRADRRAAAGVPVGAGPADRVADGPGRAAPRGAVRAAPQRCASAGGFAARWAARSRGRICMWCAARTTRTGRGPSPAGSGWCRWISLWCKRSTPTSSSACVSPRAADSDFVFVNLFRGTIGAPMRPDAIGELMAAASRRAGLDAPVRPHQLRHAFGSNVADAGAGIDVVADLLGHAAVSSSQVYVHPDSVPAAGRRRCGAQPPRAGRGDAGDRRGTGRGGRGHRRARASSRMCWTASCWTARPRGWPGCWTRRSWTRPDGIRVTRVLSLPAQHRLLGRTGVPGRAVRRHRPQWSARRVLPMLHRLTRLGMSAAEIALPPKLPAAPTARGPAARCRAAGARRRCGTRCCASRTPDSSAGGDHRSRWSSSWPTRGCGRCRRCRPAWWRRAPGRPTAPAATATPTTSAGAAPWRADPDLDAQRWQARESGVAEPGQVNLRALPRAGGRRGAVRHAAARPRRREDHRCGSAGAVRRAAPPAGRLDHRPTEPSHPQQDRCGPCGPR